VQVSNDNANWTTALSVTGKSGAQTLNFTPVAAQYVRLYFTKNNKSNYRVIEFEAYAGSSLALKRSDEAKMETATVDGLLPDEFMLEQNYPNPFSVSGNFDYPSTRISFSLPRAEQVTIKIYTINGLEIQTLVDGHYSAGVHSVVFKPKNLPSGTYFYVMQAGERRKVRRLMLVK
jgi:hypothetical protein